MNDQKSPLDGAALAEELPKAIEFFEVFRDVLNRWAYLDCVPLGSSPEPLPPLPLERSVRLDGRTLQGHVVLRSDTGFGRLLAESASGEAARDSDVQDAFTELCNQFCSHAMSSLWNATAEAFRPFLPQASRSELWPGRPADRHCLLSVDQSFVEILFWRVQP